ncbi:hypothetical protein FACS189481_5460 [Clostridia bacterium]|nr:hypothetical protein FACS189481_5460 [Clostridia bacterium]
MNLWVAERLAKREDAESIRLAKVVECSKGKVTTDSSLAPLDTFILEVSGAGWVPVVGDVVLILTTNSGDVCVGKVNI